MERKKCGKNISNENIKTTISSETYNRPRKTGECGILLNN
jgi:hypothetical protein